MSILIKGIDMPKDSKGIELVFIPKYGDIINNESMSIGAEQIVEIPTPHGRLIDADALVAVFKDMAKCEWNQKAVPISWAYAFEDTIDEIDGAPTILESEE